MSSQTKQPSVLGARLALALWPRGGGRPRSRRRAALDLALLVVTVLAALFATHPIRLPAARFANPFHSSYVKVKTALSGLRRPPAATTEAELARARPPPRAAQRSSEPRPPAGRVVASTHVPALFAKHSWYVAPPPLPPAPPPPAPVPAAPPFPYTFLGSFAPGGDAPVFFLADKDRVLDVHVGDRLEGVYQLESAENGQLVFVYLPLNVRQNLAARVSN